MTRRRSAPRPSSPPLPADGTPPPLDERYRELRWGPCEGSESVFATDEEAEVAYLAFRPVLRRIARRSIILEGRAPKSPPWSVLEFDSKWWAEQLDVTTG